MTWATNIAPSNKNLIDNRCIAYNKKITSYFHSHRVFVRIASRCGTTTNLLPGSAPLLDLYAHLLVNTTLRMTHSDVFITSHLLLPVWASGPIKVLPPRERSSIVIQFFSPFAKQIFGAALQSQGLAFFCDAQWSFVAKRGQWQRLNTQCQIAFLSMLSRLNGPFHFEQPNEN